MLEKERSAALFAESRASYADAMKCLDEAVSELDRAELVKSVEKAWIAALQATNALILARSGVEPKADDDRETSRNLMKLASANPKLREILRQYSSVSFILFDTVLCEKDIEPVSLLIEDIRATADYLRDAEGLAQG